MISARGAEGRKAGPQTDPPDIVAELDRWLTNMPDKHGGNHIQRDWVKRARDEIVRLREVRGWPEPLDILSVLHRERGQARVKALEEAAEACMGSGAIGREAWLCAAAIRLLKEVE